MKKKELPPSSNSRNDVFLCELINKEKSLIVEQLRQKAKLSQNPVIRAMHLGRPIFQPIPDDKTMGVSRSLSQDSLVLDNGGQVLLSRGALPSSVHANYSKLPTMANWADAEARHRELSNELRKLDQSINAKEEEMRRKVEEQGSSTNKASSIQIAALSVKPGSSVVGSAFQWQGIGQKSTVRSDYDWPEESRTRIPLQASKYGLLTRTCDIPGANTNINHNAKGKREPKK